MAMEKIKVGGFVSEEVAKLNSNFSQVENDYATKAEIPTVPTKTSELANDSGFVTQTDVDNSIIDANIPTKTSELTNDSGFITENDIPEVTVPTKTSDLTNDSGFVTGTDVANDYVAKESGKGLSTEDYTSDEKTKLAGLSAPENKTFAESNWVASGTQFKCTIASDGKKPVGVMRADGSNYSLVIVDIEISGANIVLTADEAFAGYVVCI